VKGFDQQLSSGSERAELDPSITEKGKCRVNQEIVYDSMFNLIIVHLHLATLNSSKADSHMAYA